MNTRRVNRDSRTTREPVKVDPTNFSHPLHRIAEVCLQQNLSARVLTKRLDSTRQELESQLSPFCDMLLSQLYKWQAALDVPAVELLVAPGQTLSPPINRRARLVKLMKSVRSLQQLADSEPLRLQAEELAEQLIDIMPELEDVDAWPSVGRRRTPEDVSGLEQRMLPDSLLDRSRLSLPDND